MLLLLSSCSGTVGHTHGGLNEAINDYIAGRMDEACKKLAKLVTKLDGDDRNMAYLYLGRSCLALGDLDKATEAFMLGKSRGSESPFDEFLLQIRELSRSSVESIAKESHVSRAQLAYLLSILLPNSISEEPPLLVEPRDVTTHWARRYIVKALRKQYMNCLPDSLFYPDENVTRSSLFYMMSNIGKRIGGAEYGDFQWLVPEYGGFHLSRHDSGQKASPASGEDVLRAIKIVSLQRGE